jgi:hypothetical protein
LDIVQTLAIYRFSSLNGTGGTLSVSAQRSQFNWRKIAITLIDPCEGALSVNA